MVILEGDLDKTSSLCCNGMKTDGLESSGALNAKRVKKFVPVATAQISNIGSCKEWTILSVARDVCQLHISSITRSFWRSDGDKKALGPWSCRLNGVDLCIISEVVLIQR